MQTKQEKCRHCGNDLSDFGGLAICAPCNDKPLESFDCLTDSIISFAADSDKVMIECPGATIYYPGTNEIESGVCFIDPDDPTKGYKTVRHPVFGPKHVKHRWVKNEDARLIRRCQSCQDHTVRMRRKEGPNLYIPSRKHPNPRYRYNKSSRADYKAAPPSNI